jgi:hypothetical protein
MHTTINKRLVILRLLIAGLLLVAFSSAAVATAQSKKPPTLAIEKPANGATVRDTVTDLKFKVSNFKLTIKNIGKTPKSGEGYLRIEVNGALLTETASTGMKITGYSPGANTIVAELMDYDRTPLEPPVRIEPAFTYQATGKTVKPDSKTLRVQPAPAASPTPAATATPSAAGTPTVAPSLAPTSAPTRPTSPTAPPPVTIPPATSAPSPTPTPSGPSLASALAGLSSLSLGNLQPAPGFDSVAGLNVGDVSLPTGYLSPTGANLNFNYQGFYELQTPAIPPITAPPGFPTGPGPGFPTPPPGFGS